MKQFLYRIIFFPPVNFLLRNLIGIFRFMLPTDYRLSPSGKFKAKIEHHTIIFDTNQTSYLTHLVYWNGPMNFEYTPIFLKMVGKMSSFLDIGANVGYYSLIAATVNPKMKVISFEPATGPLSYLRRNISLNRLSNISIQPIALSDQDGTIDFYQVKNAKYRWLKYNLAGDGNTDSLGSDRSFDVVTVPTTTLDKFVQSQGLHSVDLMKMDTEGTENLILNHGHVVLSKFQPIVICETLFGKIEKELEEIFLQHGYEFYNHVGDHLERVPTIQRSVDNGVTNCFFVPKSKVALVEPFVRKH